MSIDIEHFMLLFLWMAPILDWFEAFVFLETWKLRRPSKLVSVWGFRKFKVYLSVLSL